MARERFSFDDTIEFDKDELKPNNDIHANHTGKFTFDDEVKEKKVAKPKKKKRKLKIWHVVLTLFVVAVVAFFLYIFVFSGNNNGPVYGERCVKLLSVDKNAITQVESQIEQDENIQDVAIKVSCRTIKLTYQLSDNIQVDTAKSLVENSLHTFDDAMGQSKEDGAAWSQLLNKANGRLQYDLEIIVKSNDVKIDIDQDGTVVIYHSDQEAIDTAVSLIERIVKKAEVGEIYDGTIARVNDNYAFVTLFEGTDGFLHISDWSYERTSKMQDVCKVGDVIKVKVTKVDDKGKVNVSRKALLPKPVKKEEKTEKNEK